MGPLHTAAAGRKRKEGRGGLIAAYSCGGARGGGGLNNLNVLRSKWRSRDGNGCVLGESSLEGHTRGSMGDALGIPPSSFSLQRERERLLSHSPGKERGNEEEDAVWP